MHDTWREEILAEIEEAWTQSVRIDKLVSRYFRERPEGCLTNLQRADRHMRVVREAVRAIRKFAGC